MNKREREFLEEVYRACKKLEKRDQLTEYARGQRDLSKRLLELILKSSKNE